MKANLTISKAIDHGDRIVDDRLFPATSNDGTYTKTLSGDIDFRAPGGDKGGSFAQAINRFEYFGNLADAVWVGDDKAKYTNEMTYELARVDAAIRHEHQRAGRLVRRRQERLELPHGDPRRGVDERVLQAQQRRTIRRSTGPTTR